MAAPRNYWMVSVTPEYFDVCKEQGFTLLGLGRSHKKRVQRMEIGDRVLFYVNRLRVFPVVATMASTYFQDDTPTWPSPEPDESYAWRVKLKPNVILSEDKYLDARLIAPRMEYVRKWAPEDWPLAMIGLLHLIPKKDFQLFEDEMKRGLKKPPVQFGLLNGNATCALERTVLETSNA